MFTPEQLKDAMDGDPAEALDLFDPPRLDLVLAYSGEGAEEILQVPPEQFDGHRQFTTAAVATGFMTGFAAAMRLKEDGHASSE